jgi:hypothetical protein
MISGSSIDELVAMGGTVGTDGLVEMLLLGYYVSELHYG